MSRAVDRVVALHVVGPDSIPECERDASITFRVDGNRATETLLDGGEAPRDFVLTVP